MMKITVTVVEEYEYDEVKELKRLHACFKGRVLKRQLAIFEKFKAQDWDAVRELYNDLPYNNKEECAEQEFVGMWSAIVMGGWGGSECLQKSTRFIGIE